MRKIALMLLMLFLSGKLMAAEIKYRVADIPANLIDGADVVKRMEKSEFTIKSTGYTIWKRKYALTILNDQGDDFSSLVVYYDQLRKVTSIEGALYDANGALVKTLKSKDILDQGAGSGMNLMEDNRTKSHDFYYKNYPYTIEYSVEVVYDNSFIFPTWVPQEGGRQSVEQSSYTITFPSDYQVRYREFNIQTPPMKSTNEKQSSITWETKELKAFKVPFGILSWRSIVPVVYFAPSAFEISGYKGNMQTWDDLGKFQLQLNAGKDNLPPEMQQQVIDLTSGLSSDKDKIVALYKYFQKHTRYISVQLGLGGWQPYDAAYVFKNGYGDCKALTNYIYSLLKAAGISSNYVMINAGESSMEKVKLIEDFPAMQFNHVLLCVPLSSDTMWLECTSQELPAGYISDFTANRKALFVSESGSKIIATPKYGLDQNTRFSNISAELSEEGNLKLKITTQYRGVLQDDLSSRIKAYSNQKMKEFLLQNMSLNSFTLSNFSYKNEEEKIPKIEEKIEGVSQNFATVSGRRIFINPNIQNRGGVQITFDSTRKVNIDFEFSYKTTDNIEIEIPSGYSIEVKPEDVFLNTNYGSYSVTCELKGNKILYHRSFEQYAGSFPASEQKSVINFYNTIYKKDRGKMVLVKKEN